MSATRGSNCICHETGTQAWCGRCHSTVPVIDRMTRGSGPAPARHGVRLGDRVSIQGEVWQVWCWGVSGHECVFLVADGGRCMALSWSRHQAAKLRASRVAAADEPLPLELVS